MKNLYWQATAVALAMAVGATDAPAQESDGTLIEEVVVTGSRLLDLESSVSPVQVISAQDMQENPATSVTEYLQTMLPSNYTPPDIFQTGSDRGSTRTAGNRQSSVNLRGLGPQYTMVLVNGERTVLFPAFDRSAGWQVTDFNAALPSIAIGNVQVLSDGGSAIYGSDAVAGIVNLVPDYGFEGLEVQLRALSHEREISAPDSTLAVKFGTGNDTTRLMVAGEYRTSDYLSDIDTGMYLDVPNPDPALDSDIYDDRRTNGVFSFVPSNGMGGINRAVPVQADPLCGDTTSWDLDLIDVGIVAPGTISVASPPTGRGAMSAPGTRCESFNYLGDIGTGQMDQEHVNLFGALSHEFSDRLSLTSELGWYSKGTNDIRRSGGGATRIARGGTIFGNTVGPFPMVIPADHPATRYYADTYGGDVFTDPNGVVAGELLYNSFSTPEFHRTDFDQIRFGGKLDREINESWVASFGVVVAENELFNGVKTWHVQNAHNALYGLGGPNCTGTTPGENGCEWYNPFMSAALPDAEALGIANSPELMSHIYAFNESIFEMEFASYSLDFIGDLGIELPGGIVGVGFGIEKRLEQFSVTRSDFALNEMQVLAGQTIPAQNLSSENTVDSVYAEVALPLRETLDFQVAGRYEESDRGFDSFDPKFGINFRPTDSVTLRGSLGTSFRAPAALHNDPNIELEEASQFMFLIDPAAETGAGNERMANYRVTAVQRGNAEVRPETSTNLTLGGDFHISDMLGWNDSNLSVSLDYINIDFEDVIRLLTRQTVLRRDQCHVHETAPNDPRGTQNALLELIPVNPEGTQDGSCFRFNAPFVEGVQNTPTHAYGTSLNLAAVKTQALDIGIDYSIGTPLGLLAIRPNATVLLQLEIQEEQGGDVIDAKGAFDIDFVQPAPELKLNVPISLTSGGGAHNFTLTPRYIHGVENLNGYEIESAAYFDFNYRWYVNDSLLISAFANNVTDEVELDWRFTGAGTFLPPYGRRIGILLNYGL